MKNSEWGAISYLSQSKYGLNGTNIYINNVNLNNSTASVYAITGMAGKSEDEPEVITTIDEINNKIASDIYTWKEKNGTKASSTGTIYGIYDLSGGLWERTASIIYNGNSNLNNFGSSLLNGEISTEYITIYPSNAPGETNSTSKYNYEANKKIYGDAIRETSLDSEHSWYNDCGLYPDYNEPFFVRGGYFGNKEAAGLFKYNRNNGSNVYNSSFRAVLVAQ